MLEDPSLEGLFLDTRPANPNVPFGWEHALSPALISEDDEGTPYAKIERMQMPASGDDYSVALERRFRLLPGRPVGRHERLV